MGPAHDQTIGSADVAVHYVDHSDQGRPPYSSIWLPRVRGLSSGFVALV